MPFIWRAELIGAGPTGEVLVTALHYYEDGVNAGTMDTSDALTFVIALDALLLPTMLQCITSGYTYVRTVVTSIVGYTPSLQKEYVGSGGSPGGNMDAAGTIERCSVIRKLTGIPGRQYRGRIFLPMPPSNWFQFDGQLDPASDALATLGPFAAAVLNEFTVKAGLAVHPCIYHRASQTATRVASTGISPLVGSQRRRRFGIGI